jgi:site-specific DNA recombinase
LREKPRSEWIAVPVPDPGIPREWVDSAREAIKDNAKPSANAHRVWELSGGVFLCGECGCRMVAQTTVDKKRGYTYHYYRCAKRNRHGAQKACSHGKHHKAEATEGTVWEMVSALLKDLERLRAGIEELIEQERAGRRGSPDRKANVWLEKLSEVEQERRGYLRLAAKGHMSDDDLGEVLSELEESRTTAERELRVIRGRKAMLEELERDRDALLDSYAGMVPAALDSLAPQERCQIYGMLRLKVDVSTDGTM